MKRPDLLEGWKDVDGSPDPEHFVSFLDATRGPLLQLARSDPAAFFAHLRLREGHHVLEVGCGTGDFARLYAPLVGRSGRVVGIDASGTMVEEARRRVAGSGAPLEFRQGTAERLEIPDSSIDRAIASIVVQHLADPAVALREMVRVTRRGGLVIVSEQDWESFLIDGVDRRVTRAVLNHIADAIPHGWIGRQLRRSFLDTGLADVSVVCTSMTFTDFDMLDKWFVAESVKGAVKARSISEHEGSDWLAGLRRQSAAGRFFASMTLFTATGRRT